VRLHFVQKPDKESTPLRDGSVDLETAVLGNATGPEVRTQALIRDRFIGVMRMNHPLSEAKSLLALGCRQAHLGFAMRSRGRADRRSLETASAQRDIVTIVDGFSTALALARAADPIASVPERQTGDLRADMLSFPLAVAVPEITVSLLCTRNWMPIGRIAGCAGAFTMLACRRHLNNNPAFRRSRPA
jgi:hypothetical protein